MSKKRNNKKGGATWTMFLLTYLPFLSPILTATSGRSTTTGGGTGGASVNAAGTSLNKQVSLATQGPPKGASIHASTRSAAVVNGHSGNGNGTGTGNGSGHAMGAMFASMRMSMSMSFTGFNLVAPAPTPVTTVRVPSVPSGRVSAAGSTTGNAGGESVKGKQTLPPTRRTSLRWSGKLMNETESQKVFRALLSAQLQTVLQELPTKFDPVVDHELSDDDNDDGECDATEEIDGYSMMAVCRGSDPDHDHDIEMLRAVELV